MNGNIPPLTGDPLQAGDWGAGNPSSRQAKQTPARRPLGRQENATGNSDDRVSRRRVCNSKSSISSSHNSVLRSGAMLPARNCATEGHSAVDRASLQARSNRRQMASM